MTHPSGGDPTEEQTIPVSRTQPARRTPSVVDEQTDGSTVIARRETRRRAARDQPEHDRAPVAASARVPPSATLPTSGRLAAAPDAAAVVAYPVRPPQPVIATRSAPPARVAQAPLDDRAAHARAVRRRALVLLVGMCALVGILAGLITLIVLRG